MTNIDPCLLKGVKIGYKRTYDSSENSVTYDGVKLLIRAHPFSLLIYHEF